MGDRHKYGGYPRPRSPVYNPARVSLPINISGSGYPIHDQYDQYDHHDHHDHHLHAIPLSRREIIPRPRSSTSAITNAGTVTTTYKIKADPPSQSSSTRDGSRTRRSTLESDARPNVPTIVTAVPRQAYRPIVHSGGARPVSPMKDPYRSSQEDYYAVPASSKHGAHSHRKSYSATMDNADMHRLARERDGNRLREPLRQEPFYSANRSRPVHSSSLIRHADTAKDDYGDDGYGYTNPKDLVQYDLNNNTSRETRHHSRRDSFESGRAAKPASLTGYNDIPRSYDTREKGPPPSMRGFDKITPRVRSWDQPQWNSPVDQVQRPAIFDPVDPARRPTSARPGNVYHENREPRRTAREDYYEVRDDEPRHRRPQRPEKYDDAVEQRGFGIRVEKPERPARAVERPEKLDRPERLERPVERPERSKRSERDHADDDRSDHKGRDALAAGLGLAGAALGLNAVKNPKSDKDRDDEREERRRREYDEEPRRRKDKDDREPVDLTGRDPKDRRERDTATPPRNVPPSRDPRDIAPPPENTAPLSHDIQPPYEAPEPAFIDLGGRDPRERPGSGEGGRDSDPNRRRRRHPEPPGIAVDSRSDTSASDDANPSRHRERRRTRESANKAAPFNPKDATDLMALKAALNAKDSAAPPIPPKEPISVPRISPGSTSKDTREAAEIRLNLESDRRFRQPSPLTSHRPLRVVSPPRDKQEDKPVKGILRQPRAAFPEDPTPIREGVAPLKDAKKDGVPPDARWTKISRKLVNPEALEAGKERFEAREDFVIVLRVLSRDEVQGYAEVTQRIRSAREQLDEAESQDRRRARRERHERHKRERSGEIPRSERGERRHRRRHESYTEEKRESESDTTDDEYDDGGDRVADRPKMLEAPQKRATFEEALMSGGLGEAATFQKGGIPGLRGDNPLPLHSVSVQSQAGSKRDGK